MGDSRLPWLSILRLLWWLAIMLWQAWTGHYRPQCEQGSESPKLGSKVEALPPIFNKTEKLSHPNIGFCCSYVRVGTAFKTPPVLRKSDWLPLERRFLYCTISKNIMFAIYQASK
jgi:hypothetical protein